MATSFNLHDVGDRQGVTVVAYGLTEIQDGKDIFQIFRIHIAVKDGLVNAGVDLSCALHRSIIAAEKRTVPIQLRIYLKYFDLHRVSPL